MYVYAWVYESVMFDPFVPSGLRGAPGYSLEQAHHLPIEMDPLIGQCTTISTADLIGVTSLALKDNTDHDNMNVFIICATVE